MSTSPSLREVEIFQPHNASSEQNAPFPAKVGLSVTNIQNTKRQNTKYKITKCSSPRTSEYIKRVTRYAQVLRQRRFEQKHHVREANNKGCQKYCIHFLGISILFQYPHHHPCHMNMNQQPCRQYQYQYLCPSGSPISRQPLSSCP